MTKQKDYTKYDFKPDAVIDITPGELGMLFRHLNLIVEKNINEETPFLFDKIHKETGEIAKKTTSKKSLEKDYVNILNPLRMVEADSKKSLNRVGKDALGLVLLLQDIRNRNIDNGRGFEMISEEDKPTPETPTDES